MSSGYRKRQEAETLKLGICKFDSGLLPGVSYPGARRDRLSHITFKPPCPAVLLYLSLLHLRALAYPDLNSFDFPNWTSLSKAYYYPSAPYWNASGSPDNCTLFLPWFDGPVFRSPYHLRFPPGAQSHLSPISMHLDATTSAVSRHVPFLPAKHTWRSSIYLTLRRRARERLNQLAACNDSCQECRYAICYLPPTPFPRAPQPPTTLIETSHPTSIGPLGT